MDDVKAEFVQPDLIKVTLLDKEHMFDLNGTGENLRIHTNAFKVELTFTSTRVPNFYDFLLKAEVTAANEEKQKKYAELDKLGLLDKVDDPFDSMRDVYKQVNPDQKHAMMKSFYESGGTVLSVDHKQVFKGHVHGYYQQKDIDDAKRARGEPVDGDERYSGHNAIDEVRANGGKI